MVKSKYPCFCDKKRKSKTLKSVQKSTEFLAVGIAPKSLDTVAEFYLKTTKSVVPHYFSIYELDKMCVKCNHCHYKSRFKDPIGIDVDMMVQDTDYLCVDAHLTKHIVDNHAVVYLGPSVNSAVSMPATGNATTSSRKINIIPL